MVYGTPQSQFIVSIVVAFAFCLCMIVYMDWRSTNFILFTATLGAYLAWKLLGTIAIILRKPK